MPLLSANMLAKLYSLHYYLCMGSAHASSRTFLVWRRTVLVECPSVIWNLWHLLNPLSLPYSWLRACVTMNILGSFAHIGLLQRLSLCDILSSFFFLPALTLAEKEICINSISLSLSLMLCVCVCVCSFPFVEPNKEPARAERAECASRTKGWIWRAGGVGAVWHRGEYNFQVNTISKRTHRVHHYTSCLRLWSPCAADKWYFLIPPLWEWALFSWGLFIKRCFHTCVLVLSAVHRQNSTRSTGKQTLFCLVIRFHILIKLNHVNLKNLRVWLLC